MPLVARWACYAVVGTVLMVVAGCGGRKGPPLGDVTGTVSLYGRPVVAELLFQPLDKAGNPGGRPSLALSDGRGRYTARFTPEENGAIVGPHRVTVTVFPFADEGEPATYEDATKPLRRAAFERNVEEGTNRLDFPMTL